MMDGPIGACRTKVGLLSLRDCEQPGVALCDKCRRPICRDHQVLTSAKTSCPSCASGDKTVSDKGRSGRAVRRQRRRRRWHVSHGYYPYYYGCHHYYSDHDYHTFDESQAVHHDPSDGVGVGDDADFDAGESDFDMDDMGES